MVYREARASVKAQEESWFDAAYGDQTLGLIQHQQRQFKAGDEDEVDLIIRASGCGRFLAIRSSEYPRVLFVFSLVQLHFLAALFLTQPVSVSFAWHPSQPVVLFHAGGGPGAEHLYSWQPEGARSLPHPYGAVEGVQWLHSDWALILGPKSWTIAIPTA